MQDATSSEHVCPRFRSIRAPGVPRCSYQGRGQWWNYNAALALIVWSRLNSTRMGVHFIRCYGWRRKDVGFVEHQERRYTCALCTSTHTLVEYGWDSATGGVQSATWMCPTVFSIRNNDAKTPSDVATKKKRATIYKYVDSFEALPLYLIYPPCSCILSWTSSNASSPGAACAILRYQVYASCLQVWCFESWSLFVPLMSWSDSNENWEMLNRLPSVSIGL